MLNGLQLNFGGFVSLLLLSFPFGFCRLKILHGTFIVVSVVDKNEGKKLSKQASKQKQIKLRKKWYYKMQDDI